MFPGSQRGVPGLGALLAGGKLPDGQRLSGARRLVGYGEPLALL